MGRVGLYQFNQENLKSCAKDKSYGILTLNILSLLLSHGGGMTYEEVQSWKVLIENSIVF